MNLGIRLIQIAAVYSDKFVAVSPWNEGSGKSHCSRVGFGDCAPCALRCESDAEWRT
jgi:hypothetical protein